MTTIDFFVHPDIAYDQSNGAYNPKSYQEYFNKLLEKWNSDSCKHPVLIKGFKGNERFENQIKKQGTIFESASYNNLHDISPTEEGEVHPKDWEKFVSFLKEVKADKFRIHGSYYGGCPEEFAVQLYAHLYLGEHWHNWIGPIPNLKIFKKRESKKQKKLEKQGVYLNSNIRYGIILSPPNPARVIPPSELLKSVRMYPQGNITYQLTDQDTNIILPEFQSVK